ncbi:MAG: SWIM zinc finger family protein [Candidatus Hodarchaeales archaeon]
MTDRVPGWILDWIAKDRLVRNKFKISKKYLRHSKRIHFVKGEKNDNGEWESFHYKVYSDKYGHYNVKYSKGNYHCNCPFFKHRLICSHILGVCQRTGVWPPEKSIFPDKLA